MSLESVLRVHLTDPIDRKQITRTIIRADIDLGIADRTAVVTGGAGRIGSEDCRTLAQEGVEVVVLDVDRDGAEDVADELVDEYDATAHAVECDLTDRDDVADTVAALEAETGGIDTLINNAGLVHGHSHVEDFDDDIWDRDVAVNLTGTYNISRAVFPHMKAREWGRIITISSIAGWRGGFGQISYSARKSALLGFGKSLALEGGKHGITSNILTPTVVVGDLADLPHEQLEAIDENFARLADATPMGHLGREEDVAPRHP